LQGCLHPHPQPLPRASLTSWIPGLILYEFLGGEKHQEKKPVLAQELNYPSQGLTHTIDQDYFPGSTVHYPGIITK